MAEILLVQEDGSLLKTGIKIEIRGTGVVRNPDDEGWVDMSNQEEETSSDGQSL